MRSSKTKLLFAVALLLLLGLGFFFFGPRGSGAAAEGFGVVERGDMIQRVTIAGTVVPKRKTVVSAPYDGYVKQLFVKVGDKVKAGQPLVSVAQSLQTSEPVFPQRAPYAGTVVYVQKYEGEAVKQQDPNDAILRVDDLSALYVQATAPEVDRTKLTTGQEAVVKASAVQERTYAGVIEELTLAPKDTAGQISFGGTQQAEYPVRIKLVERDAQIGPGMSVVIDIVTAKKENVLMLRHEYVLREGEGYVVTLLDGKQRPVKVGMQNEEAFEIKEGLQEGERVQLVDFTALTPESE